MCVNWEIKTAKNWPKLAKNWPNLPIHTHNTHNTHKNNSILKKKKNGKFQIKKRNKEIENENRRNNNFVYEHTQLKR